MKTFLVIMACLLSGYIIGHIHKDQIIKYQTPTSTVSPICTTNGVSQCELQSEIHQRAVETRINIIINAIGQVESRGTDIGVHPDGVSYGRYGMTQIAIRELKRVGIIDEDDVIDLTDPKQNRTCAKQYLILLKSRYGTWELAVAHWNYNDKNYLNKILDVIELNGLK